MSLYTDASLIMFPSGYKEDKIYSLKPTDGSGDLTFTRASTATRVNSDGLIEKVRTNLVTYSEQLDNAEWTKGGVGTFTSAITTGFVGPFGDNDAQRYVATIASVSDRAFVRQLATLTSGITYSVSFWVKSNTGSSQDIYFMFQGGAVQATTAITSWQRISYSATTSTTSVLVGIEAKDLTIDILIYGFQLEVGDVMTEYIPTTTTAVSVGMLADVPRIDYTGGGCGKLLLEPQRTNNVTYSEQLNNAAWALVNAGSASAPIVTANYGISPDGSQNAERVQFSRTGTTASDYSLLDRSTISTAAGVVSFYGKSLSGTQSILLYYGTVGQVFTLTTEWQRFSLYSPTTTTDLTIGTRGGTGLYYTGGSLTIDCLLWGFQKEAGSYPTSYIPTLASSVTRLADAALKTGISSLIGATEGVLFCDVNLNSRVSFTYLALSTDLATTSNYLGIGFLANSINFESVVGAALQANIVHSNSSTGRFKIAAAYKANDFVLYINGVQIGTDTSGTVPACSQLGLNAFTTAQALNYNSVQVYKTRLTNDQLATLTTL